MGDRFRDPDETNPRGFYEDCWFKENNEALLAGRLSERDWCTAFQNLLIERRSRGVPWGLKDPRIAYVWPLMEPFMDFTRVIRCKRSEDAVVASLGRCYGWAPSEATATVRDREGRLDLMPAKGTTYVYVDANPTEEHVMDLLKEETHV
jgi:hypothetical protein